MLNVPLMVHSVDHLMFSPFQKCCLSFICITFVVLDLLGAIGKGGGETLDVGEYKIKTGNLMMILWGKIRGNTVSMRGNTESASRNTDLIQGNIIMFGNKKS